MTKPISPLESVASAAARNIPCQRQPLAARPPFSRSCASQKQVRVAHRKNVRVMSMMSARERATQIGELPRTTADSSATRGRFSRIDPPIESPSSQASPTPARPKKALASRQAVSGPLQDGEGRRVQPVVEGRLLEVEDAVEARRHEVVPASISRGISA